MYLYREPDIISEIKREITIGHMKRMPEGRIVKEVFKNIPEGKRSLGKPSKRWLDDIANDLKKMDVRCRRRTARDGDAWKWILKETRVQHKKRAGGEAVTAGVNKY
jgi:hypothetical protein